MHFLERGNDTLTYDKKGARVKKGRERLCTVHTKIIKTDSAQEQQYNALRSLSKTLQ